METPQIFLTDYASYNEGTQFEFGHWVDLSQYSDESELFDYMDEHFKKADKTRPLSCGSPREERMFTDFENFPKSFYSECGIDFEALYIYLNADENERLQMAAYMWNEHNGDIKDSSNWEDYQVREITRGKEYEIFEEYFPEAEQMSDNNNYVTIDYERFVDDYFCEFDHDGETYYFQRQ